MTNQQIMEYKVVHLTLKDEKRWESILNALGREGWVLSGTVPMVDVGFSGFATTKGAQCIMMHATLGGQSMASSQPGNNSAADAFARGSGARHTG